MMTEHDDEEQDQVSAQAAQEIWEAGEERLGPAGSREAGLERARAQSPPETAAVRHGLYLDTAPYMLCDACQVQDQCPYYTPDGDCALERDWAERQHRLICQCLAEDGHDPERYESLIMSAIGAQLDLARVERYQRHVRLIRRDEHGDHRRVHVAQELRKLRRDVRDALAELTLTPASRAKLAADGSEPQAAGAQMARAMIAIDAEFEAEDSEPPADDGGESDG